MNDSTQWALITGASSGIGRAFAQELGQKGWSLLLTGRKESALQDICNSLKNDHPNHTFAYLPLQLEHPDSVNTIVNWAQAHTDFLRMLINNAGYGTLGRFDQLPLETEIAMVRVQAEVPTALTHRFLPDMISHRLGTVIFVGSFSGFMATPYAATYSATKAYLERFGLALWYELRGTGVSIYVLTPGYTQTDFHERIMNRTLPPSRLAATPEFVARFCLKQIERHPNRCLIIPGFFTRMTVRFLRLLPLSWITRSGGRLNRWGIQALEKASTASEEKIS